MEWSSGRDRPSTTCEDGDSDDGIESGGGR